MKRILNKCALYTVSGLFFCFLIVSLHACISSEVEDKTPKRTILFYIGSDNNKLDNGAKGDEPRQKIDAIRRGWQPGKGEMLIYTDQTNRDACLMRITDMKDVNGYYRLDTLEIYMDDNSADAEVLKRVVNKVARDYPADSYGMIFFSHASGMLPDGMLNNPYSADAGTSVEEPVKPVKSEMDVDPRSLVIDKGSGSAYEMEYDDFASALSDIHFDFIIFEACFMADACVMYELRDKTDYALVSSAEIIAPGFKDIYTANIMGLYHTSQPVEMMLTGFANAYCNIDKDYNYFTMSIVKMSEMNALAAVTKTALNGKNIHEENLSMGDMQTFDRPNAHILNNPKRSRFFDLGYTIESLISESDRATFNSQMNKTVIWKEATGSFIPDQSGFYITHHSGLTTYIEQAVYPTLNSAFEKSKWYRAILP